MYHFIAHYYNPRSEICREFSIYLEERRFLSEKEIFVCAMSWAYDDARRDEMLDALELISY